MSCKKLVNSLLPFSGSTTASSLYAKLEKKESQAPECFRLHFVINAHIILLWIDRNLFLLFQIIYQIKIPFGIALALDYGDTYPLISLLKEGERLMKNIIKFLPLLIIYLTLP